MLAWRDGAIVRKVAISLSLVVVGSPYRHVVHQTCRRRDTAKVPDKVGGYLETISRAWEETQSVGQRPVVLYPRQGRRGNQHRHPIAFLHLGVLTQVFSVQCTNTTKGLLAVRISVDACYIQQYLLHPTGEAGDTVTCHGTRSHSMKFQLVSGEFQVRRSLIHARRLAHDG